MTGFQLPPIGLIYILNDIFLATQEGCIWLSKGFPGGYRPQGNPEIKYILKILPTIILLHEII